MCKCQHIQIFFAFFVNLACPGNCFMCKSGTECVSNGCDGGYSYNVTSKMCQLGKNSIDV